jgi:hypothetical protein
MMALNICDGFSLLFGTMDMSVELVAANSSKGSEPNVLGIIQDAMSLDRSLSGQVSGAWLLQRPGH